MIAPAQRGQELLALHAPWVESRLAAPISDCVLLDIDIPLREVALDHLARHALWRPKQSRWPALVDELSDLAFADGPPSLCLSALDTSAVNSRQWTGQLRNAAVSLHFRSLPSPVVMLADESIEPGYGVGQSKQRQWIVAKQSTLAATLSFFHAAMTRGRKRVRVFGGEDYFLPAASEHAYSWNDVLLDEARQSLVRQDFEHFLERREWFAARRVPWRRGYLFHGPPGNGKTSAVRAMASHPGLSVFSINFAKKEVDDFVVSEMFEAAADYAPGLIVLEDFDRVFVPASDGHKPECSFSHILNCLDGLSSQDGTLVVATANQPEKLDDAILRRPGRFDRVVQFPLPDAPLRLRYLSRLCERAGDLTPIVRKTERFSFAQLREVWILACQNACVRDGDVTLPDLEAALAQVKREQNSTPRGRFGFLPLHESKSENIPVPLALQP